MASSNPIRVVQFKTEYKKKAGEIEAVDWVEYCAVGMAQKSTTWQRVDALSKVMPDAASEGNEAAKMAIMRWQAIEPAYAAWKSGQEIPVNGTPFAVWPGVTPEQAEQIKLAGLKTVEELAEAGEAILTRVALPNMRQLKEMAGLFLQSSDRAKSSEEMAALVQQNNSLKDDLEEMKAIVLAMQAEREADKPRRGRPPKVVEEEATA